MPRQKQQLVKPCPKCGRKTGFVYLRRWSRSNYKQKIDYNGNKYLDYDDAVKKKLIQEPDPVEVILSDGYLSLVRSSLQIWKEFRDLIPQIFEKYPQLFPSDSQYREAVTRMIDVIPKSLTPLTSPSFNRKRYLPDKRSIYGLDYLEWSEICIFSERHSLRETAKRYGLSVNVIKSQMKVNEDLSEEIVSCSQDFFDFLSKLKMSTDEELKSQFHANCEIIIRKSADDYVSTIKRAALVANNSVNTANDENRQKYKHNYQYYYIVHQNDLLDNETRIMHPDRKIRCGPFTELQMPIELLLEYQNRHQSKNKNIPNIQKLHRYKIHVDKINSFRVDYPKQLEVLRKLYHDLL